jgi:hypothetical protein
VHVLLKCHAEPLPDPSKFVPHDGEPEKAAMRRRHADAQAEYNAITYVAINMLVMSFSQKGIDELRKYQEPTILIMVDVNTENVKYP